MRLALAVAFLCATAATAQPLMFPKKQSAEAFGDRAGRHKVSFEVYFLAGGSRYLPVDAKLASLLSDPPLIEAPAGMHARVVGSVCRPKTVTIVDLGGTAELQGGEIVTTIELAPEPSMAPAQTVTVWYPLIDALVARTGVFAFGKAEAKIDVRVWPSMAAKQEKLRAEEEQRRVQREREQQEQALKRRQEEAKRLAAEAARREARKRLLIKSIPYAIALVLLLSILYLGRGWYKPDLIFIVPAGGHHLQKRLPSTKAKRDRGPGTIMHTVWARNWMGLRKRIKMETFVADDGGSSEKHGVDVLVSVGRSVPAGTYVASRAGAAVKVVVRDR